ncbi:MAG: ribonuclease E/G [bacterium]
MSARLVIAVRPGETRAALLEDGRMRWFDFIRTLHKAAPPPAVGTVFLARVRKVEPGLQAAFVELPDGETALLSARDVRTRTEGGGSPRPIERQVHEGEAVIVQISRTSQGGKGPRVTADPALPGPAGKAVYPGRGEETPLWERISEQARKARPPALLWRPPEPDPAVTLWRACPLPPDVIEVDHNAAAASLRRAMAATGGGPEIVTSREDVFSAHGLDQEVDGLTVPLVALTGGGSLMIEPLAALTAIDVNSGAAPGSTAQDTALRVNLDAAREIPRQIALRRLGGIVVIDFLRLKAARHRREVLSVLGRALEDFGLEASTPAFSRAGLVELVLKRRATPLHERLGAPCPHCDGSGEVPDTACRALALLARIVSEARRNPAAALEARASPEVIAWLGERGEAVTHELERFAIIAPAWRAERRWPPERMDVRPRQEANPDTGIEQRR